MNPIKNWKRFVAIGCTHGHLIDRVARDAILRFCRHFRPHTRIHLGDAFDLTCFRTGALRGDVDSGRPVEGDMADGTRFMSDYQPTLFFCGNHEARLWKLCDHPSAIVAGLAGRLRQDLEEVCAEARCKIIPYAGVYSFLKIGNYKFGHGYLFNENACRDHAEAHGNVIFAHTHRAGIARARRDDDAQGICTGTLAEIQCLEYSHTKRSTLSWSQGFVFGEYSDSLMVPVLFQQPKGCLLYTSPSPRDS